MTQFVLSVINTIQDVAPKGGFWTSFFTSFSAIFVCEIGDKTFFLAMVMAMKYKKLIVFAGAYGALAIMTILSTIFGAVLTTLISKTVTDLIVAGLFFFFGGKLLYEAYNEPESETVNESQELKEVEKQLQEMHQRLIQRASESNKSTPGAAKSQLAPVIPSSMILWQACSMTFLAQWGDRSQIATIALGASYSAVVVTIGALLGHLVCTLGAVQLGQWIGKRVKERTIHLIAGVVFILSGIVTLLSMMVHEQQ